ncbi:MAG TPA: hypothetical protein VGS11_05165 [Candidatus Bathyarchaeia archaeon]|nr:hypothetical protein [Candidatus Bathyarchaeia archaeon]
MGGTRKWVTIHLAPIARALRYPPSVFAEIAERRLEKHWTQTYIIIGLVSNAFITFVTFVIDPKLTALESGGLPGILGIILAAIAGVVTVLILIEYQLFLGKVHRRTVELTDKGPCKLKLTILRVHMKRRLISAVVFAVNIGFTSFVLSGVHVPFLTGGIPYFFTVNVLYLTEFRLGKNKDTDIAFESVGQLQSLSPFYQTLTMRIIRDKIKKRLKQQIPIARSISPNLFLRQFYLDHLRQNQPSASPSPISASLKATLIENGDVFGVLNQPYPQPITPPCQFEFELPWEKRFNWGRLALSVVTIIDVLAALYTLRIIDAILRALGL